MSFIHEVHLEEGAAVVLVVRPQQRLQDDVIVGDAPGMQVADQRLHKVSIRLDVIIVPLIVCKADRALNVPFYALHSGVWSQM